MLRLHLAPLYRKVHYFLNRWLLWGGRVRPGRMYAKGRPLDPEFLGTEQLYSRCKLDWIDENGHLKPTYVRIPDQSVNREKYSQCKDVLLPDGSPQSRAWLLWGVASVRVEDLPPQSQSAGGVTFQVTVEHDPLDDNYGHCELRVYKDGHRECDSKKVNSKVKKEYQVKLARRTRVIVRPLV